MAGILPLRYHAKYRNRLRALTAKQLMSIEVATTVPFGGPESAITA
jgi:hypothetical protein